MSVEQVTQLVEQYRVGLEAELSLLRQLEVVATHQREASEEPELGALDAPGEERDRLTAGLVAVEHQLKDVRRALAAARDEASRIDGFDDLVELHRTAATLVARILATDAESLRALQDAERARRAAAQALERGENTLAAYRRVVAPPLGNANIVNRRG